MASLNLTLMAARTFTGNTHRYLRTVGHLNQQCRKHRLLLNRNVASVDTTGIASLHILARNLASDYYGTKYDFSRSQPCLSRSDSGILATIDRTIPSNSSFASANVPWASVAALNLTGGQRFVHTTSVRLRDESKVEETLEAIKDTIKKAEPAKTVAAAAQDVGAPKDESSVAAASVTTPVKKKSIREKVVAELKHYYHGFRLLFIDVRVCARLLWQVLNGKPLMRREQKQLVRTTADMFRLVPFLVFIIVPFAEFLLPVALKLFPGMLPSTFKEEDKEKDKVRKTLKMKLEMAKFLQDTIEETALQRKGATGESVHEFVGFMEKIRTSGVQTSNEEILKFSQLFEDEITLDNLNYQQLSALCKMVEVRSVGPSYFLRFQLEMKLRQLEADDKLIQKEGLNSMAVWELQEACRQRGMRSFGVPEIRLKSQLSQWLDLHLNHKIPASLLLLSRTLYLPENLSTEDQLKATISALPEATAEEAKVKILEVTGDRVDNKSKLEIIRQEEEMIQQEKAELERLRLDEELQKLKAAEEAPAAFAETEIPVKEILIDKATLLDAEAKHEIDSKDLEEMENILENIADKKMEMNLEVEELKALKEDVSEYQENLGELQGVMEQSGGSLAGLKESKAAQRLRGKVSSLIDQIDTAVSDLGAKKEALIDDIKAKEGHIREESALDKDEASRKQILEEIKEERHNLVTISELLESIKKLQKLPDSSTKFENIAKALDEDKDGIIDVTEAMKVIDLLGNESVKLNPEQLAEIIAMLRKEEMIEEDQKKLKKLLQQKQAKPATETVASEKDSKKL